MSLACPLCSESLEETRFNNIEVDVCSKGCGAWFDYGELKDVEESDTLLAIDNAFPGVYTPQALKESMADTPRKCVRHPEQELSRYHWNLGSGLVFDKCATCQGMWLDAGELEGYAEVVKKFRTAPPELTPELVAKLGEARVNAEKKLAEQLDIATQKTVRWDFWLVDDALRGLMKMMIGNSSGL